MRAPAELVSLVFCNSKAVRGFSLGDWDRLVRQARQADLLARLYGRIHQDGLDAAVPAVARWHFEAATALADSQKIQIHRELKQLCELMKGLDVPLVVLKGTAYVAANLPAASGRSIRDIDLLVPPERLDEVQSALKLANWRTVNLPEYDQRYYRRWWHDAPSLQHFRRTTVINIHHAILPETARFCPDTTSLRQCAVEVPDFPGMAALSNEDRILHAATLLFHDDGLPHGLRDLNDLDLLLRHAAVEAAFWPRLLARAERMELSRPLWYALRYARHFFVTPIPNEVQDHLASIAPSTPTLKLMDGIYTRMLAPNHHSCSDALTPLAWRAAYMRAHWLRRPPRLLVPHLFHKAFVSPYQRPEKAA